MSDKDKNNEAVAAYDWEVALRNSDCDAIRRMSHRHRTSFLMISSHSPLLLILTRSISAGGELQPDP